MFTFTTLIVAFFALMGVGMFPNARNTSVFLGAFYAVAFLAVAVGVLAARPARFPDDLHGAGPEGIVQALVWQGDGFGLEGAGLLEGHPTPIASCNDSKIHRGAIPLDQYLAFEDACALADARLNKARSTAPGKVPPGVYLRGQDGGSTQALDLSGTVLCVVGPKGRNILPAVSQPIKAFETHAPSCQAIAQAL